ncbi:translocation/assembly module TamB domain-containing protein [Dyadobacter psychrotolerans]|uniref:Translocation/assembly module TamB n=1 Tax=Dyadobacter psychrotolerans TaxID=2541721 RepID=A0A4V2Z3P0_9BACT|nr:translocation/assembly module TamB domain-containing protein [Dyadobacter psychrotolerans]TDE13348.1 translocation/assembly module TamB [Dyadobacter psychrotolerans]
MLQFLKVVINSFVVVLIFALLALGIATIALQIPSVQTFAVQTAAGKISKAMGYPLSLERVNIKWFDVVSLEGVSVKDTSRQQMIDVDRIDVNLNLSEIIENSSRVIHLDEVNVYQPNVHLRVVPETGDLNIDGFINKINELTAPKVRRPANAPENNTPFTIGKSRITDGTFSYDDPRQAKRKGARIFDYSHFTLNQLNGDLKDFLVQGDTISFLGRNLKMVDKQTGLNVKDLDTRFLFCQKKMELKELDAHIGDSHLKDEISFFYNRSGELGDFNHKVYLKGHLVGSEISSKDLGLFSEYVDDLNETWRISGNFNGKVDDFVLSDTDLFFGKNSRLLGDIGFKGLPKIEGCIMDIRLSLSKVEPADIVQYYPEWDKHPDLAKFGLTLLDGTFKGTLEDFAVDADVSSALGKLSGDLVFHIADAKTTTYSGEVTTTDFELGTLLDDEDNWQKLDFAGKIFGKGLELKFASTNMDALVTRVGFRNYNYRNIKLKGNIQNQYFNGHVAAKDSNLVVNLNGEFDLSRPKNFFDVRGVIEKANLQALGFIKDSITLRTELDVKVAGNTIDELTGDAKLLNTYLVTTKTERNLVIDTLVLSSVQNLDKRTLKLESEFLTARVQGDFLPTVAWKDLSKVLEEYKLYFLDNEKNRQEYYANKPIQQINNKYQIDYELETRNLSRFLAFISPDIYVSKGAKAEGFFKMDNTSFLTLTASADTLKYGTNQFITSEVDITTSKFVNSAEVLASALVTSEQQKMSALVPTEKLEIEGAWDVDHIDFNGGIRQISSTNRANLGGEIRFLPAGLDISFKNSKLNLLDEEWNVPSESLISIVGSNVNFTNLGLISGRQRLTVNGVLSNDPSQSLILDIRNFRLGTLNTVLNTQIAGIMDGTAKVKDAYNNVVLDASFNVESLGYAQYEFGNFAGTGEWDTQTSQLEIDAQLSKNAKRVFNLTGGYRPKLAANTLNLKAVFNQIDFKAIEPFAEGLVSDVSGKAQGTVTIKGTVNAPVLEGSLAVEQGKMKFDYLQSVFTFNDKITFSESEISGNNILLTDQDGNTATLRGGVFHEGFKYFTLGFNADLRNFKILNTAAKDNDVFYGTAYVTGPVAVFGSIDNLNIEANVTSNKGTRIHIPLDGATEVVTQDYIQFVSQMPAKDSTETASGEEAKRLVSGGIKMDFNFNLTPDAACEIIFDRQTGDIIRANGNGRLNLNIDTKGDFTMTGTYEIDKGDYNFTLQNVINKKFNIKPGSRIVWSGDPYGAMLDVKAGYTQLVSLMGVLPNTTDSEKDKEILSRRYPVEVTIGLSDRLMAPQIRYDLKILDNPSLNNLRGQLEAFQNKLKSDEQELSRQVSSLLVINQLLPESSSTASSTSILGNSISELVSNQISRWASGINENLEVGVSGLSLDQNALNNLQLRFSYRFLNDRFRVTRDGRISSGTTGTTTQYDAASLLGEWTLEYWLNPKGSVRVKAYNRNIQSPFSLSNTVTTGGMSVQFTHSFNRFVPIPKPVVNIPYIPMDSTTRDSLDKKLLSRKDLNR